jgi:hypothetical protein
LHRSGSCERRRSRETGHNTLGMDVIPISFRKISATKLIDTAVPIRHIDAIDNTNSAYFKMAGNII